VVIFLAIVKNPKMNLRIKSIRDHLKLKQNEFAEKLGIKQSSLSSIENVSVNVSPRVLKDVCASFNVNKNWLLNGEGDMFITLTREDEIVIWASRLVRKDCNNEFAKNFARVLSRLDDSEWALLEKMAYMMVEENKKG
jgi:Helix-turn-helix.